MPSDIREHGPQRVTVSRDIVWFLWDFAVWLLGIALVVNVQRIAAALEALVAQGASGG